MESRTIHSNVEGERLEASKTSGTKPGFEILTTGEQHMAADRILNQHSFAEDVVNQYHLNAHDE